MTRRLALLAIAVLLAPHAPLHAITPNAQELELASRVVNHPQQQRTTFQYDAILNLTARAKAYDMIRRNFLGHVDPDGYGPNAAAALAGYQHPYGNGTTNNIESVAPGRSTVEEVLNAWLGSSVHRDHLLGQTSFYRSQTRYGAGVASVPGAAYTDCYVFVTAPPNPLGDNKLQPYTEWLFEHFTLKSIATESDRSDSDSDQIPRLVEFLLSLNPKAPNQLPVPVVNTTSSRLEWTLPLATATGNATATVQTSSSLGNGTWTSTGVTRVGNTFSVPLTGNRTFLRILGTR
jgi:hypothetical protein